jgi:hypothetical protein
MPFGNRRSANNRSVNRTRLCLEYGAAKRRLQRERIVSYATDKIDPAANGVAIFACWGAEEFFEAIQLTAPVSDNRVYAYNQPHLYHLARLDEQYPGYADTPRCLPTRMRRASSSSGLAKPSMRRSERQEGSSGQSGWMVAVPLQRRVWNAHQPEPPRKEVDRLMQQYRARGLAVVGPQETLEALANGQVEELLISGALEEAYPQPEEVQAILAPEIPDSEGGTKSEEPRQACVPDLLVTKA